MQQFGFSATDVKLKQWDETPKFGSNATFSPTEISRRCLPNYLPRHPLYRRNLCPNSRVKTHPFGENCRLKPFPKVGKYQPGMDAHAFSEENQVLVVRGRAISSRERTGVSSKL